jgi:NhaP-type Na+/H+ and K+/H+ antiporter
VFCVGKTLLAMNMVLLLGVLSWPARTFSLGSPALALSLLFCCFFANIDVFLSAAGVTLSLLAPHTKFAATAASAAAAAAAAAMLIPTGTPGRRL